LEFEIWNLKFKKMSHLDNEQHISQQDLLRYVEDDCSRLEMRAIDRHLATCPACSDAVEGLMLLSEPSVAVAELNKKIDAKVAEKIAEKTNEKPFEKPLKTPINSPIEPPILQVVKRPFWQQRWAAAAAILLLFSGSFWFYKNTQSNKNQSVASLELPTIADSLEKGTPQYKTDLAAKNGQIPSGLSSPNGVISSGELAQKTENKSVVLNNDFNKPTDGISNSKPSETAAKPSADIAIAEPKVEVEKAAQATASAPVAYEVQTDRTRNYPGASAQNIDLTPRTSAPQTDRTRDYSGASAQNSVPRPTTSAPTKSKDVAVTQAEDNSSYDAKKSDKNLEEVVVMGAAKAKKQAKKDSREGGTGSSVSTPSEQLLSRADDNFKQKKYENAATDYTQFLSLETSGDRHERALFQLASCYAKLNKKAEAKVIFEKLSATDGQFQRAAKKALKDL
jgi:Putative zinc-finger